MVKVILRKEEKIKCPECGSEDIYLDPERGELVCKRCGAVIEQDLIDLSQEWRPFEEEEDSTTVRAAGPISMRLPDQGTTTLIGTTVDYGELPPQLRKKFKELKKVQFTLVGKTDRNVKPALAEISRICSILGLPSVIADEAARLYRKAAEKNLIRGRSMENVVAACVYVAARRNRIPITLSEIAEKTGIPKKEVGKTFRYLSTQLGLKVPPIGPEDYIYKFGNLLKLPAEVITTALKLLRVAKKKGLTSGKGPAGVAAALLYIAALLHGIKKTQREIAEVAKVTEVTIRNRYKELVTKLGLEDKIREIEAQL